MPLHTERKENEQGIASNRMSGGVGFVAESVALMRWMDLCVLCLTVWLLVSGSGSFSLSFRRKRVDQHADEV
jgi:hypothetical protein